MDQCLFCRIGSGDIASETIVDDSSTRSFLDVHPRALGHTLVIPKVHAETLLDLPDQERDALFATVTRTTRLLQETLHPDGFTIGINHGAASGQAVAHIHTHIIPRWFSDGGGSLHVVVDRPPAESIEQIAERIRQIHI